MEQDRYAKRDKPAQLGEKYTHRHGTLPAGQLVGPVPRARSSSRWPTVSAAAAPYAAAPSDEAASYHSSRSTRREAEAQRWAPDVVAGERRCACSAAAACRVRLKGGLVCSDHGQVRDPASPLSPPGWSTRQWLHHLHHRAARLRSAAGLHAAAAAGGPTPFGGTGAACTRAARHARFGLAAAEPWRRTLFPAPARALRSPCHNVMECCYAKNLNCATLRSRLHASNHPSRSPAAPRRGAAAPPERGERLLEPARAPTAPGLRPHRPAVVARPARQSSAKPEAKMPAGARRGRRPERPSLRQARGLRPSRG